MADVRDLGGGGGYFETARDLGELWIEAGHGWFIYEVTYLDPESPKYRGFKIIAQFTTKADADLFLKARKSK